MNDFANRVVLITGAGHGIGREQALQLAAAGAAIAAVDLHADPLQALTTDLTGKPVAVAVADVTDRAALIKAVSELEGRLGPVDLLIANAGISIDKDNSSLDDFSIVRKTLEVNVGGVLNTVEPLVGRMSARRQGQIAVVSSLASFIGLPYSASYNASKAAVRVWGESIRYVLKKDGIGVSVVCPGFVVSRMTAQAPFAMPFLMSAQRAAGIIRRGLARNKARIAFPVGTKAAVWLGGLLPGSWTARLLGA
jgi:short-subunit dehydrogenase